MKTIQGRVTEISPYTLMQRGSTVIEEVRIEGQNGTTYAIRKVAIDARLANALRPGNQGTFHICKIFLGNNFLVAAEFDGGAEFAAVTPYSLFIYGIFFILVGIPTILLFGMGILLILLGISYIHGGLQIMETTSRLRSTGVNIRKFEMV